MLKTKQITIAVFINIIILFWFLREYNSGYNILDFIDKIEFILSFSYGVPIVLSHLLAILIIVSPGIGIYFFLKICENVLKKQS